MQLTITAPPWAKRLISDLTDMDRAPKTLEPGSPPLTFELPDDVYFQYAFVTESDEVRPDPDSGSTVTNLWYGEVSEVRGPDYRPAELADVPPELAAGSLERVRVNSRALGGEARRASLYTPAGANGAALPLMVVQDGVAFQRVGRLAAVLEALLERGEVQPARLLMIEPVDRLSEYAFNEAYSDFVLKELIPQVTAGHPTAPRRVWLGASLGGQASAYLLANDPSGSDDDAVVALSGAFLGAPGDTDHYRSRRSWLLEWLESNHAVPGRWHLDVGSLEWLEDVNLRVGDALAKRGVERQLTVRNSGHNWVAWRNAMPDALRFALG